VARLAGQHLLHYRLVEKIGQGGMGSVWHAQDTTLDRDAAIKILPDELAEDEQLLARFEREAKLLASLNHPNLASVFGVHEVDSTRFLAMELVPGEDLSQRLRRGPLPLDQIVTILGAIADALEAAHARGVIHRDLKPGNVRLAPDGRVKVLDFGLAKSVPGDPSSGIESDEHPLTATGVVLGTAPYMSPEQARGLPVDARTDIWSFGCVLWECLTGDKPFPGETLPDLVVAILNHEPDWTKLPAGTPPSLVRLLRRCLAKSPRHRLHHIADARIELEDAAAEPAAASGVPARRPPAVPLLAFALLAAVAALVLVLFGPDVPAAREGVLAGARFTKLTNFGGEELAAVISPDGASVAFVSDRDGPFDTYVGRIGAGRYLNLSETNPDTRLRSIKEDVRHLGFLWDGSGLWFSAPGGGAKDFRRFELPVGPMRKWLIEDVLHVDWSPDGSRIVYSLAVGGDTVFVADPNGANSKQILSSHDGFHQHFPTWSKDGRWIFIVRGYMTTGKMDLYRMRPDGSGLKQLTTDQRFVGHPTPIDDRTLLFVGQESDGSGPWLWELDLETLVTRRAALGVEQYFSVSASRDGRRLVGTVSNPQVGLWTIPIPPEGEVASEEQAEAHPLPAVRALAPRIRGDQLFYLSSIGGGDGLWRHRDGRTEEVWPGPLLEPASVSPDGSRVAVVVQEDGQARLYAINADGTAPRALMADVDVAGAACWSPDGKWIAAGGVQGGSQGLFKVRVGDGTTECVTPLEATNPIWSPDGRMIVFAGPQVRAFTGLQAVSPEGRPLELPATVKPSVRGQRFRFLPDGSGLVYMKGSSPDFNFHLLDLQTGRSRQLTQLVPSATMRTFDITPDGEAIVFDRQYENSDIVLIERDIGE